MASGDGPVKWPGPVTFDDNRPKSGFAKIFLKVPDLKAGGMFSGGKAKNADVSVNIKKESVCVTVEMHGGNTYRYDKQMPENINSAKSECKIKDGRAEVTICKEKDVSWGGHATFLIRKPDT